MCARLMTFHFRRPINAPIFQRLPFLRRFRYYAEIGHERHEPGGYGITEPWEEVRARR